MNQPSFSIIIPSYNRAQFLPQALASASGQTYPAAEIIVVDDGSTDATAQVMRSFPAERVRYIQKEHSGVAHTRNRGIKEAKGDYIVWLDSDDLLVPHALEAHQALLDRHEDVAVSYGDLLITDGDLTPLRVMQYEDYDGRTPFLIARMFVVNSLPNGGTAIRRDLFSHFGGYDPAFHQGEDYEWWTRILKFVRFKHVGYTIYEYRWDQQSCRLTTERSGHREEAWVMHLMLERYSLAELFPDLVHSFPEEQFEAAAYLRIAKHLVRWEDFDGALEYLKKSNESVPNPTVVAMASQVEALYDVQRVCTSF